MKLYHIPDTQQIHMPIHLEFREKKEKKAYLEYSFWPKTLKQWNALLASQVTASNPYISLRVEYVL